MRKTKHSRQNTEHRKTLVPVIVSRRGGVSPARVCVGATRTGRPEKFHHSIGQVGTTRMGILPDAKTRRKKCPALAA